MTSHTDTDTLPWKKSSFSNGNGGACVEVAELTGGGRAMRDSKNMGCGPTLWFTAEEWRAFKLAVAAGEFD